MQNKLLKTIALICIVALGFSVRVFAQDTKTVTGTVYGEKKATLPGATIQVKGTTIGTTTDLEGKFTLKVPLDAKILVISFMGMEPIEAPIGTGPMKIDMVSASTMLNEVVVIGYGSVQRNEVTSAISSVKTKDIKALQVTGIDQALQGKVSGVTVTSNSGQPGGGVAVRVRGLTSINSNDPLIVIDGVPFNSNTVSSSGYAGLGGGNGQTGNSWLANLNPNDIESIDILKDASAQAIYGSQAANGVLLVTTKKGKSADGKVTYDGSWGWSQVSTRLDLMNLQQFATYQNEILPELGMEPTPEFYDPSILGPGTDWQDAIFQTGLTSNHSLSFSGAKDKLSYYISAGYLNQTGTLEGSDFERFSTRFSIDGLVKSWLKVGMNGNAYRSQQNVALADNAPSGTIWQAAIQNPLFPVKNIDGSWGGGQTVGGIQYYQQNPVAESQNRGNNVIQSSLFGDIFADILFNKDFSFKNEFSYNLNNQKNTAYQYAAQVGPSRLLQSTLYDSRQNSYYWALRNYFNFNKVISKHTVSATLGHEAQYSYWEALTGKKISLQNDILDLNVGSSLQTSWELSGGKNNWSMESWFARGNYMYNNTYSASISFRADASSNFGPNNKWGYFPGVSLGWTVTNEKFAEAAKDVLSYMKIRFGFGNVGNQNLPSGAGTPPYSSGVNFWPGPVGFGTVGSASTNFTNYLANPDLSWEKVSTTNLGFDLGFIDGRIESTIDLYTKSTSNMLLFTTGPSFLGIGSNWDELKAPIGNVGQMTNKGIDFNLTSHNFIGAFTWSTTVVISKYNNVLDQLLNDASTITGSAYYAGYPITHRAPGHPVGSFYGLVTDGIYRTQEDLDNALPQFGYPVDETHTWLGDVRFKDINGYDATTGALTGQPDGKIDAADETYIGSPIPDFTLGFTNNFAYKGFDASIFFFGSFGAEIYNFLSWQLTSENNAYYNQLNSVSDRYTSENINGSLPRFTTTNTNNTYVSDRYVEDGSYFRLQNLTIGYSLPQDLIKKAMMSRLRVFVSGTNLITWTKYTGYDPEIGSLDNSITMMNVDLGHYPNPRTVSVGVSVEF